MNQVEKFFEIFIKELEQNEKLRSYHRFINSPRSYLFRRAYYQQRLEYIVSNVADTNSVILDVGCGYGTTSFLLGYLGYKVKGTTLEYYYDQIENRKTYWNEHFNTENVDISYENLFTAEYPENTYDYIIVQDTLHHLEPIDKALSILQHTLKPGGKILVSEENGNNLINNAKNFKRRGFKRVVEVYDEKLDETYQFGDENTRSLKAWKKLFKQAKLDINTESVEYIRVLPPASHRKLGMQKVIEREKQLSNNSLLREFLFFGINYFAQHEK